MATRTSRARATSRGLGCLLLALALVVGVGVLGVRALQDQGLAGPVPGQERCVVTAGGRSVVLEPEQAELTSIIVGLSVRRGLAPRAASIAMATVYQETGIRNLDYGDRDSVGLFQQRPSQGWGTPEQLQDPYYATGKFYDALVKVPDWENGDINDVAQRVQRSGFPEAYRDHEADARVLASALTGQSRAAISCLDRSGTAGAPAALATSLTRTFGQVTPRRDGALVTVRAGSTAAAWAYAHHAVANAARFGVVEVQAGDRHWRTDGSALPGWTALEPAVGRTVQITLRPPG